MHSDIFEPFSTEDARHNQYIITLIDDYIYSRFIMACAPRNKSDAAQSLQELIYCIFREPRENKSTLQYEQTMEENINQESSLAS